MNLYFKQKIGALTGIFFLIRIFSYFFSPDTPLHPASFVNTALSVLILGTATYFIIKNDTRGWLIVAAEMILGGSGGYFQIFSISLRTWLAVASLGIYFIKKTKNWRDLKIWDKNNLFLLLILVVGLSALVGYKHEHNLKYIYSDLVPYFYLLYYYPLRELLKIDDFKNNIKNFITTAIIGNLIFILFTFFGFITNLLSITGNYYHWYRDVALGKITAISTGFYRITLDEQLLLIPMALILMAQILKKKDKLKMFLYAALLILLAINITRIYILALGVGFIFLYKKENKRTWLKYGLLSLVFFISSFSLLHLCASGGKSFGFELLGLRLGSIAAPQIENSSLSRLLLFPKIIEKIELHPIFGTGLGDIVSIYSPVFKMLITTTQFDWGYLEIAAEMGLLGFFVWLFVLSKIIKNLKTNADNKMFLPAVMALLTINLTSPALFHQLGIIFLTTIVALTYNFYDTRKN